VILADLHSSTACRAATVLRLDSTSLLLPRTFSCLHSRNRFSLSEVIMSTAAHSTDLSHKLQAVPPITALVDRCLKAAVIIRLCCQGKLLAASGPSLNCGCYAVHTQGAKGLSACAMKLLLLEARTVSQEVCRAS
jgi:hypothetical protein